MVIDVFSNSHEAKRLRVMSLMSYEGYEEFYKNYEGRLLQKGLTPEVKMTKEFFDEMLARLDLEPRLFIIRMAERTGVPVPPSFLQAPPGLQRN
jgi:hypothetical protein